MATFMFEERRLIRNPHLHGMASIEIHRQLGETFSDTGMDVEYVNSWLRQLKEGRTSC